MPRNGSGQYSLPQPAFVAGTVISSAAMNSDLSDIASALTASLPRDGQVGMLGQLKSADGSSAAPTITFGNEINTGFYRPAAGQIGVVIQGNDIGHFTSTGFQGVVSGLGSVPVGTIVDFAGGAAPTAWYLCYGQNVSRTKYAALFAAIGATYGSGDGSTTFGLPDLRGRVLAGKDDMGGTAAGRLTTSWFGANAATLGAASGLEYHILTTTEIPAHYHAAGIYDPAHTHGVTGGTIGGTPSQFQQSAPQGGNPLIIYGSTITISNAGTGVRVNSSNGIDTTYSNGGSGAHAIVQPSFILNKIIYAGA